MIRKTAASPHHFQDLNCQPSLIQGKRYVRQGSYVAALQTLGNGGHDVVLKNARGVCLLRMGRYTEALQLYRALVMRPNCVVMRPDLPSYLKGNYATALLLIGQTEGCLQTLAEVNDDESMVVERLQQNLRAWKKRLSWGSWLRWNLGLLDPAHAYVPLDFLPGVFEDDVVDELSSGQLQSGDSSARNVQ